MTKFSKRVTSIDISGIRKMFEGAGPDAINLGLGQPDFDTPENIKAAAEKAIRDGKTGYTNNAGIDELREAVSLKLKNENGLSYSPKNVVITAGGSGALSIAISSLIENGEKVIFNNPGFVSYGALTVLAGGVPEPIRLRPDLHLDVERIKEEMSNPKTKVFVLNSPSNPTGMVETPETIRAVVESAEDYDVTVISDEVYEKFCYGDTPHVSAAKFGENVITINAVSKTYAMTGWRIGFLAASEDIVSEVVKIQQYNLACPTSISQYAALEAYEGPQDSVLAMKNEYKQRRDLLISGLLEMGVEVTKPDGAFYAFPKINLETVTKIVNAGVIITPGTAFGTAGQGYARMSYANSQANILTALERIRSVV